MSPSVELTILGCGTSTGVPRIQCRCKVCRSKNPKNHRLRASAWVKTQGKSLLLDTSIDLRAQALRFNIDRVDAILYTHPHADHIYGIDEMRAYNYLQKQSIPVYGNAWTLDDLEQRFSYIFKPVRIEGGGVAQLSLNRIDGQAESFQAAGVPVTPISTQHGSIECLGYRIGSVAYVTDCSYIPAKSIDRMKDLDVLVLDCLQLAKHGTHFNLDQALEVVSQVRPKKTFLTHLGHDFDYSEWTSAKRRKLPPKVTLAHDGLKIRVGSSREKRGSS